MEERSRVITPVEGDKMTALVSNAFNTVFKLAAAAPTMSKEVKDLLLLQVGAKTLTDIALILGLSAPANNAVATYLGAKMKQRGVSDAEIARVLDGGGK